MFIKMVYCPAYNCGNSKKKIPGVSYHKFPMNNPELVKKWLVAMGREDFVPNKWSRLCSEHFAEDAFLVRPNAYNTFLKHDAVPTIFNFSLQPKYGSKRKRLRPDLIKVLSKVAKSKKSAAKNLTTVRSLVEDNKKDKFLNSEARIRARKNGNKTKMVLRSDLPEDDSLRYRASDGSFHVIEIAKSNSPSPPPSTEEPAEMNLIDLQDGSFHIIEIRNESPSPTLPTEIPTQTDPLLFRLTSGIAEAGTQTDPTPRYTKCHKNIQTNIVRHEVSERVARLTTSVKNMKAQLKRRDQKMASLEVVLTELQHKYKIASALINSMENGFYDLL